MDYGEAIEYLYSIPMFTKVGAKAYKPGCERILELMAQLDNPHQSYKSIHVAGTNGKGSSSSMISSVLMSGGYSVGLYTSPHLFDFRERIRVNGKMITHDAVTSYVEQMRPVVESCSASFFEVATAMALDYFRAMKVDYAIIETGIGGLKDATNIISPVATLITNIGFDHMAILGDTLEEIASEKGGIIKEGIPLVIGEYNRESTPILESIARENSAPYYIASQRYPISKVEDGRFCYGSEVEFESDLRGEYQGANIASVVSLFDIMRRERVVDIPVASVRDGIATTAASSGLQGRWHRLSDSPVVVCDTAHNSHGMGMVLSQLMRESGGKFIAILGFAEDKDLGKIFDMLPVEGRYIFTQADTPRAIAAQRLLEMAQERGLGGSVVVRVMDALKESLEQVREGEMIFIGGSNFVVGEVDIDFFNHI